jgi:hypothetical protein
MSVALENIPANEGVRRAAPGEGERFDIVIRSLLRSDAIKGLVIAGMGLGDAPSLMFDAIQDAREHGIPVVISTRVPTNGVGDWRCATPVLGQSGSSLRERKGCRRSRTVANGTRRFVRSRTPGIN